jgi:LEA14-like dessication related protein
MRASVERCVVGMVAVSSVAGIGVGAIVGVLLLAALVGSLYRVGGFELPSVRVADVGEWGAVVDRHIEVVSVLEVTNRNPILTRLGDSLRATYHLDLNGVRLADGMKDGVTISNGTSSLSLTTAIRREQLPAWWVAYIRNDETIDVQAGGEITFTGLLPFSREIPTVEHRLLTDETPVLDALTSAADSMAGRYTVGSDDFLGGIANDFVGAFTGGVVDLGEVSRAGYEIERGWATWGEVTREETTVVFHFEVRNAGNVPVPSEPDGLHLTLEANNVTLFEARNEALSPIESAADRPLAPGERRTVKYPVAMDNRKVGDWFRSHVRNGERTRLTASLQFVFRPPALGLELVVPSRGFTTATCNIQTSILTDQPTRTDCSGLHDIAADRGQRRR